MDWSRKQILSYASYSYRFVFQIGYLRASRQGKYFSNWRSELCKTNSAHIFSVEKLILLYPENAKVDDNGKMINRVAV